MLAFKWGGMAYTLDLFKKDLVHKMDTPFQREMERIKIPDLQLFLRG